MRKNKEDLARLKEIKHSLIQLKFEIKTAKDTIKTLRKERYAIKEKYKAVIV